MAQESTGDKATELTEDMNPSDSDTFWMSWTGKLNGESIVASSWVLPDGWTEVSSSTNGSVTEDGVTHTDANSVTVTTTATTGKHILRNQITTATRAITRSLVVTVNNCV